MRIAAITPSNLPQIRMQVGSAAASLTSPVRFIPDKYRACVLAVTAAQNVLIHERNTVGCYAPISNSSCISNLCSAWHNINARVERGRGEWEEATARESVLKYLRTICDNKCHLIRNRRDPFASMIFYALYTRDEHKVATSLLNVSRLNA